MNRLGASGLAVSVWLTLGTAAAVAHHSAAAFDTRQEIKVTGTVTEYSFRNPHVYLVVQVTRADGSAGSMEVEGGAASVLNGLGFRRDAIAVGDLVTVVGNPARSRPDALMLGKDLYKRDGSYIPLNIASRSIDVVTSGTARSDVATSLAGTWFSPRAEFTGFLGGAGKWPVTAKGKAAIASADPAATTQKDCIPIGIPALMFYPVANTITVQRDRVVMKIDWMDAERVIYLDGRGHPPAAQTSLHGHSVGRFEGDTLVVETTNFSAHPLGLSASLPGSTGRRLTERFRLSDDRKGLIYSGVVEDPEYLAKPVEWSGRWLYRPNMPHSNEKCDVTVARRFLDDLK
jgi:hypothetical protein